MIRFNKIWIWLKKYSVWIAIVQALVWPISIGTSMYWSYKYKMSNEVPMIFRGDGVVLSMLKDWHTFKLLDTYRSKEDCEYMVDALSFSSFDFEDCTDFESEGQQLLRTLDIYDVEDEETIQDILITLYFDNERVPYSVKKLVGEIKD